MKLSVVCGQPLHPPVYKQLQHAYPLHCPSLAYNLNAHQLQGPILLDKHGNHAHNFQPQPPFLVTGSLIYLRQQSIFKFFNEWDGQRKGESANAFSRTMSMMMIHESFLS